MKPLSRTTRPLVSAVALSGALILVGATLPAFGASVSPTFVKGNPTCISQGYALGFKVDPPNAGTYSIGTGTVTVTTDGIYFDWSSTLGMDAVIAKGGPNANVYKYDPPSESFGDTGLVSPTNKDGKPYGLSHIEFCYDNGDQGGGELTVGKTVEEATYDRTVTWNLDKTGDANYTGFAGDKFVDHTWTVTATKTETLSNYQVTGEITIGNPNGSEVEFEISDTLNDGTVATVNCPNYIVQAGGSVTCTYTASPEGKTATLNTAVVTTLINDEPGLTFEATAEVSFTETLIGYDEGTLSDPRFGYSETISGSTTKTFNETFTCPTDASLYTNGMYSLPQVINTANLNVNINLEDSATVNVTCYAPVVSKTAKTSYDRKWTWTIEKVADQKELEKLSLGQTYPVNYTVTVTPESTDSNWAVEGTIKVTNPSPDKSMTVKLSDTISGDISATLDCGGSLTIPEGGNKYVECGYKATLPDATARTNTATATISGVDGAEFTGKADVVFGGPTNETDECVKVSDTYEGVLAEEFCASNAPGTFEYTRGILAENCGDDQEFKNIASFVTNDDKVTGSDDWTITINVDCTTGCTLTPGYWKTHSKYGPAPYDDNWEINIEEGALFDEDTSFFKSGQTYYQVLWTPPAKGNAYYILAHAYIAAKLNIRNDASSTPEVDAAIALAEAFFKAKTPTETLDLSKTERNKVIGYAGTLDGYNNGSTGPGHCNE